MNHLPPFFLGGSDIIFDILWLECGCFVKALSLSSGYWVGFHKTLALLFNHSATASAAILLALYGCFFCFFLVTKKGVWRIQSGCKVWVFAN